VTDAGTVRAGADGTSDWRSLADRALAGDRPAYARLARLVTGYLARWRAYDFHADWDDIVQEVLISTLKAHREGRLATPAAFQAYVRQAARFKFVDRIRVADRTRALEEPDSEAAEADAYWPPRTSIRDAARDLQLSIREALAALGERERAAVLEVHVQGRTYEEAAEVTGIPLGSLKRALRTGLSSLREVLDAR
jgi:RNA polymerase sigma-70 factor (ECF subfamily)